MTSRPRARPAPRLRRAAALVARAEGGALVFYNFVARRAVECTGPMAEVLTECARWTGAGRVERMLASGGERSASRRLAQLLAGAALVAEGSTMAARDEAWRQRWKWGPWAGAFHFGLRDPGFFTDEETMDLLARRAARERPPPGLPSGTGPLLALPPPRLRRGVLPHLLRRHSERDLSAQGFSARELSDVLFAGFGVRRVVEHPVLGTLVYKMAPSGGARNAIEGYVYALRVDGVPAGVHRYHGTTRQLEPLRSAPLPAPRHLLGGQPWTDGAAALVFLVATFERTSWKYRHPLAYRAITLEAGHIAQNVLVAACDLGLAATPTCALHDSIIEAVLGIGGPDRAVMHAVVLGRAAGSHGGAQLN